MTKKNAGKSMIGLSACFVSGLVAFFTAENSAADFAVEGFAAGLSTILVVGLASNSSSAGLSIDKS